MKKLVYIFLSAILILPVIGCQKSITSTKNVIYDSEYKENKNNFVSTDIENYSLENQLLNNSSGPSVNYYLDEYKNLWSWKITSINKYLENFKVTNTEPEIVLKDIKKIIKTEATPYDLRFKHMRKILLNSIMDYELELYKYEEIVSEELYDTSFDYARIVKVNESQMLFAYYENKVIYVDYYGYGDLKSCIDKIYNKIVWNAL